MDEQTETSRDEMRRFLAAREAERGAAAAARRVGMADALPGIVALLRDAGAARAWVFGSFVGGAVDAFSDLDLAVAGLPPERYIATRVKLAGVCPVPFDLVEFERAPASLQAEIERHGRELF